MDKHLGFFWTPPTAPEEIHAQFARLVATGANTVCVPHAQLTRALLDQLHAQGLRVLAEQSLFVGDELRQQFPDSVPIDADGRPYVRDGWYVPACPNHPQVRRHRLDQITALLDHFGDAVDGLWLDFIRFPVRWEGKTPTLRPLCFCRHCLNLFLDADAEAYSPAETAAWAQTIVQERHAEWVDWKCRRVAGFVQTVREEISTRGLALPLGIFALPWPRTAFDGAMRRVAGQDLAQLAQLVDYFSPMVYHKLCEQSPAWIAGVIRDHSEWAGKPILPIVQAVHRPDTTTPAQLDQALAHALDAAPAGALIFTLDPILTAPELAAVVGRHVEKWLA